MKQALVRRGRHACRQCGRRHARFAYRGVVKWDRSHELCFRCFRSLVDAQKARRLVRAGAWASCGTSA
jgi:hypothetical protein